MTGAATTGYAARLRIGNEQLGASTMTETVKYLLDEEKIPKDWSNIVADLPRPPDPVLHPGTLQPVGPQDLEPLFPLALIRQEVRPSTAARPGLNVEQCRPCRSIP
jgi:hypothetical protein